MKIKNIIVDSYEIRIQIEEVKNFLTIDFFNENSKIARFIGFTNKTHTVDFQIINDKKLQQIGNGIYEEFANVIWEEYYLIQFKDIIETLNFTDKINPMCKIEHIQKEIKRLNIKHYIDTIN